jgi:hypothetical protein
LTTLCQLRSRFAFAGLAALFISASAVAQTAHLSSATTQNFGSINVGTASTPATLTFTFDTAGVLGSTSVVTQGATGQDFTDAGTGSCAAGTSYAAGATCTVKAVFKPTLSGDRYGAAVLYNSSGTPIATGYLQGKGKGPQVNFMPGTSTMIDSGLKFPDGLAVDSSGDVYIADWGAEHIVKETPSATGYTQTAIDAGFVVGRGIAVDGSGNLFITSHFGGQVFKETLSNGSYVQSLIASGMDQPNGIAIDGSGNLYLLDSGNDRVLVETLLPDGSYTQSQLVTCGTGNVFSFPWGIAVDSSGNIYVVNFDAYPSTYAYKLKPSGLGRRWW